MALADAYKRRSEYESWLLTQAPAHAFRYSSSSVDAKLRGLSGNTRIPAMWALYEGATQPKKPRVKQRGAWDIARDPGQPAERRAKALSMLCDAADPRVNAWVVEELHSPAMDPTWRSHLIDAAEHLIFESEELRARLKDALALQLQGLLNDGDEGPTLWAAMRRYGTLLVAAEAEALYDLLDAERQVSTRQLALRILERIILMPGTSAGAATPRLRDASVMLLNDLLGLPSESRSAEQDALLINALCACAAMGDERTVELARRFALQADDLFRRLASKRIQAVMASLRACLAAHGTHAERALPHAEATLTALVSR